jgi:hypothetical protein
MLDDVISLRAFFVHRKVENKLKLQKIVRLKLESRKKNFVPKKEKAKVSSSPKTYF